MKLLEILIFVICIISISSFKLNNQKYSSTEIDRDDFYSQEDYRQAVYSQEEDYDQQINKREITCCKASDSKCCVHGFKCCSLRGLCYSSKALPCMHYFYLSKSNKFNRYGQECGSRGYKC